MSEEKKMRSYTPPTLGALWWCFWLPLLVIGFEGCWDGGCQGALNAESRAIGEAYNAGGWGQ